MALPLFLGRSMKKILLVRTGGTICSASKQGGRVMDKESLRQSKTFLEDSFKKGNSPYSGCQIVDAFLPIEYATLSESMTLKKLSNIIKFIFNQNLDGFDGVIVLHGTDTLAYTSALFSFAFSNISVPMVLVSGNKPPQDGGSNALENFTTAIELICQGLAPNVYVCYKNSDNVTRLYLGSKIMQCQNYSEDFYSPNKDLAFNTKDITSLLEKCSELSKKRGKRNLEFAELSDKALLVTPYTGLDYSTFSQRIKSVLGVIHGSYHSGTVCMLNGEEENSKFSVKYLANICKETGAPMFIAPSKQGDDQYETVNEVTDKTCAILLDMPTETAYAKLVIGLSCNLKGDRLIEYMKAKINNEFE